MLLKCLWTLYLVYFFFFQETVGLPFFLHATIFTHSLNFLLFLLFCFVLFCFLMFLNCKFWFEFWVNLICWLVTFTLAVPHTALPTQASLHSSAVKWDFGQPINPTPDYISFTLSSVVSSEKRERKTPFHF